MNSPLAEVLQDIRTVIDELDRAATVVPIIRADLDEARTLFESVVTGTAHATVLTARHELRTAADKVTRLARLLAVAAESLAEYVDRIAPGSVPLHSSTPDSLPRDGDLTALSPSAPLSGQILSRLQATQSADDGLQHMHELVDQVQDATRAAGKATPPSAPPDFDADHVRGGQAGDLLLGAMTITIVGIKAAELLARLRANAEETPDGPTEGAKVG